MDKHISWEDLEKFWKNGVVIKRDDGNYYITALNKSNREVSLISTHANPLVEKPFVISGARLLLELNRR